jgi:transposase
MNKYANLPRRSFDPSEKLNMVLEALKQEQPIVKIASQNAVNVNQLSRWIREYREGAVWAHKAQSPFYPLR